MQTPSALHHVNPGTPYNDWSEKMAGSVIKRYPLLAARWQYESGVVLSAIQQVWLKTQEKHYFEYIKHNIDEFVAPDGTIRTYSLDEYNLDQIDQGKLLFFLYRITGDERYKKAASLLRKQLQHHPRTREGGFWHKLIYPHQMWLDGLYMAGPFYAEFAQAFDEPEAFDDITHQFILIESHTRDPKTGLLYHGWDESRNQIWADPETGCSPNFWGRAMGWYLMAIVDVLDFLPSDHPQRQAIIDIFEGAVQAVANIQDPETGVWYQLLNRRDWAGNYLEASASSMFVYAIARAVRQGTIAARYLAVAQRGYQGILDRFVEVDSYGLVHLHWICGVAGLGKDRNGSVEYYLKEKVVTDDYKGIGPFIMASVEMEHVYR